MNDMSRVVPAVVLKSQFVISNDKAFDKYINYIDRDDAKVKKVIEYKHDDPTDEFKVFHKYMDYMDDDKKDGELFTDDRDLLSDDELKKLKKGYQIAQKNGSPLWQDVISFDNDWLEEQGLYDPVTHSVNEDKLRDVSRKAVDELLKQEKIKPETMLWTGSIHYNTDNIHIHLAMVQPEPIGQKKTFKDKEGKLVTQFRGKRKQKSLDRMKSKVANEILDRNKDYERIDELIRNPVREKRTIKLSAYNKTKDLFIKTIPLLPDDMKQWKYGYNSVDAARPYIDKISRIYLEEFHSDEIKELYDQLDKQVDISERLFGSGSGYHKYKDNKLDDLRKRMGNAVLEEMREFHKTNRKNDNYTYYVKHYYNFKNENKMKRARRYSVSPQYFSSYNKNFNEGFMRFNRAMRKSFHEYQKDRNIAEFDRMLEGYE